MNSLPAKAMMLAIGLQESRFVYRHQGQGPAGGFWQFEETGVRGVVEHKASRELIAQVLKVMAYQVSVPMIQDALDHNDILAAVYARLLLWTHPNPLPLATQSNKGWIYYVNLWRPGRPQQATWDAFFQQAWAIVQQGEQSI